MGSFSAQIATAVADIKGGIEMVVRQSAQDVLEQANRPVAQGGAMPVDTGFLRNSLAVGINAEPVGAAGAEAAGGIETGLAGYSLGDVIMARWTAAYAKRMEYGFHGVDSLGRSYQQQGFGFVRQAAQKWPAIVAANAQTLLAVYGRR